MRCTCEYCRDIDYDNSEYFVDRSHLNRPRPVGVTGLLRVKNDAEFLALCIDSCIEALDELVIVYQPCDDDSPRIIESKRRQYPDKIRTYFYRPVVLSHHLTGGRIPLRVRIARDIDPPAVELLQLHVVESIVPIRLENRRRPDLFHRQAERVL